MDINNPDNQNKIAIVVVGYNRLKSIKRLLASLLKANYPSNDIPLIISIDCSGDKELYNYVHGFDWPFGYKYLIIHEKRLGLKNHIFSCGDITKYFKAIILLEDDIYVSEYFYNYVEQTVVKYGNDDRITQISLYKNERNGFVGLPFVNIQTDSDVFLMKAVSTWGQCWTKHMWDSFKKWMLQYDEKLLHTVDMPDTIKRWKRAWSKYYNAYLVSCNKYVIYPNVSLTTNFSDAGEHGDKNNSIVQVNLQQSKLKMILPNVESLIKYDIYGNNESIYNWINILPEDICLDLYGFNRNILKKRYILSTRILQFKIIKSFALNMRPLELNIKENINGKGIFLYDSTIHVNSKKSSYSHALGLYFFGDANISLLRRYVLKNLYDAIKRKLHL